MSERLNYNLAAPDGMKALDATYAYIRGCGLPAVLIDLVYLRVSQINGCAYCIDLHTRDLQRHGVATGKLMLISAWQEAGALFSARERAALAWAETVTRVEATGIPDAAHAEVAEHFEGKALADLTIAISLMNAYNRLAIGFRRVPGAAAEA
ncbi:carboxymuconolactone decarboxylase family protein [Sphingomonas sp.]|uniref:carboxymuconolactone decarboxylase family protein n=1 Tax=Sphingomonas sp. TaxID=28214 RepID=UPI003B00DC1C